MTRPESTEQEGFSLNPRCSGDRSFQSGIHASGETASSDRAHRYQSGIHASGESAFSDRALAGRLIAIASGKGGVGKTWFAITLAHALVRRGQRVLLFDADLGLANVDVQLGLTPGRDLGGVLAGGIGLSQAVLHYGAGGFDILPGRSGSGLLAGLEPATLDGALAALREAARGYDFVLLDLGAGLERPVRHMAAFADTLLVVATDEPTSLTDAYAVVKLHATDRVGGDARIVVNQAQTMAAGERTYATLRRACAAFLRREPALAGVVRRDERVRDAIRRQTLLLARHPASPAGADVEAIARGVGGHRAGRSA
jgi:flagellar biosynthesis protein FlhG